jgi:tryptophan synthase beta chain
MTGVAATGVEHRFGPYGGQYVPETLMPALAELEAAWLALRDDEGFRAEVATLLRDYAGRPTPLLAKRMGKQRIIAETGAGSHGVATATACALLGIECVVFMGTEDMRRQAPNVQRMRLLGARVQPVDAGTRTLKEATSAAIRDWTANPDTYYVIGSVVGPAPYPALVRDLQRVIGDEARAQMTETVGRLPDRVIACVGGGSNALGIFWPFVADDGVKLVGVEAGGAGIDTGRHGAPLTSGGRGGVLHGAYSAMMQDEDGQVLEAHSVSAGLDYPGTGPQHSHLRDSGRATYVAVTDADAIAAFARLSALEGIVPALESSHAVAWVLGDGAVEARADTVDLVCLSGRGDKDLAETLPKLGLE